MTAKTKKEIKESVLETFAVSFVFLTTAGLAATGNPIIIAKALGFSALGSLGVLGFGLIAGNGNDEDDASRHHGYEMDKKYLGY